MFRIVFRLVSFVAAAIFLWNSTIFIFYNFGLFWTFAAYFTFFITFFFFPVWAYFFFGYFDLITTLAWFITVVEAFSESNYRKKKEDELHQLNLEHSYKEANPIIIFPSISDLSEYQDKDGKVIENSKTDKWIKLKFDPTFKFTGWEFSPKIAEMMDKNAMVEHSFQHAAQTWGNHISSEFEKKNEIDLTSLPKTFISNKKFLAVDPMLKGYFTEHDDEE